MLFSKILVTIVALFLTSTSASPIATVLQERAPVHKQGCAGDYSGKKVGVLACADVWFNDFNSITINLSVRDTRGDHHSVYGWFRVYGPDGYLIDLPKNGKLNNNLGQGRTVSANGLKWDQGAGRITGFRAKACVSDWGKDTCVDGPFIPAPK